MKINLTVKFHIKFESFAQTFQDWLKKGIGFLMTPFNLWTLIHV